MASWKRSSGRQILNEACPHGISDEQSSDLVLTTRRQVMLWQLSLALKIWKLPCHCYCKGSLPVSSKPVKIASQLLLVCPQCLFLVIVEVSAFYAYYFYAIWLPVRKCAAFKLIFINDNERSDLLFCALPAVNTTPRKREEKTARKWYKWFTKDYIIRLYNQVLLNNIAKADHCIYWKIGN